VKLLGVNGAASSDPNSKASKANSKPGAKKLKDLKHFSQLSNEDTRGRNGAKVSASVSVAASKSAKGGKKREGSQSLRPQRKSR